LYLNGLQITGSATGGSFESAEDLADAINLSDTGRVVASLDTQSLTKGLEINGVTLTGSESDGSFTDRADLVAQINAATDTTGVTATMDTDTEEIVLSTEDGEDIVIGDSDEGNALGITSGTYSKIYAHIDTDGTFILANGSGADILVSTLTGGSNALGLGNGSFKGQLTLASEEEIRIGFSDDGIDNGPAELAKLGLRTGAYIDGAVGEDLLVFVSTGSAMIAGSYDATMADPASLNEARLTALRAEKYDIQFTTNNQYQITWKNPANGLVTVLAERSYDPMAGIEYRGLKLTLNGPPSAGDKFIIDGNQDGKGNNQNMLDIIALERKAVIGGVEGKTISQAYIEEVGKVGNFSSQATIAQKALQVVNDQAIEARDKVSGVTLDGEAADLIRFQQAYQAAAKTIQVAGTLFDSILQASR
jgi:flagellar hook-associated protein FlgK